MNQVVLSELLKSSKTGFACGKRDVDGYIQLRMNNVGADGSLSLEKITRIPASNKQLETADLQPGDVLFNCTNSSELVGKTCYFPGHKDKVLYSNHFVRLRCRDDLLEGRYLFRWLTFLRGQGFFTSRCVRWVNQATYRKDDLLALKIPLPPLTEQRRIAKILDAADALRTKRREAIAQLDALVQSTFLEMFGDPVQNPKGWQVVEGAKVFQDLTYGTSTKALDSPKGDSLPVLRIPNIVGGQIDWKDLKFSSLTATEREKLKLIKNDLLLVRTNGNPNYIGRCARFDETRPTVFASYLIRCRLGKASGFDAEFIKNVIEAPTYRHKVRREARTTAGNYNLSTKGIRNFRFIQPPIALQERFAVITKHIGKQKDQLQSHLTELDYLFAALQDRAFQGVL